MNDKDFEDELTGALDAYTEPQPAERIAVATPDSVATQLLASMRKNIQALTDRRDQELTVIRKRFEDEKRVAMDTIDKTNKMLEQALSLVKEKGEYVKALQENINLMTEASRNEMRALQTTFDRLIKSQEDAIETLRATPVIMQGNEGDEA